MMKHAKSVLTFITFIAFSLMLSGLAAKANADEIKPMQRYIFTYNFDKGVSPVLKRTREVQQHILFEIIVETQMAAHRSIYRTVEELEQLGIEVAQTDSNNTEQRLSE